MAKSKKQKGEKEVIGVEEARLHLPFASPTARQIRQLLTILHSLVGQTVIELGQLIEEILEIEYDNNEQIIKASLVFPPKNKEDAMRARELLNPDRPRKSKVGSEDLSKEPTPAWLATPLHLKLNSYGLCELRPDGRLVFRLIEGYEGWVDPEDPTKGKVQFIWELPAKYLQMVLKRWLAPEALLAELPGPVRQGTTQENAQQIGSYLGLKGCKQQPYNSFPRSGDRRLTGHLRAWRESVVRLIHQTKPFIKKGVNDKARIADEDWQIFCRGPRPKRMTVRFIESHSIRVFNRHWQEGEKQQERLYALIPIFKGLGEKARLALGKTERLFWWHKHLDEFSILSARPSKKLKADYEQVAVPLEYGHTPGFAKSLQDPQKVVCWSLLAERRERSGGHWMVNWYLQLTLRHIVCPAERPNLLAAIPTLELIDNKWCSCIRWELVKNGAVVESVQQAIDWIPGKQPKRNRSWQRTRHLRVVKAARHIVRLAESNNANLAIGEITAPDKRHGTSEANILASRWNYLDIQKTLEYKALDRDNPIATLKVSEYERRFTCPTCGACQRGKADETLAETVYDYERDELTCRHCRTSSKTTPGNQIRAVALAGWHRHIKRVQ